MPVAILTPYYDDGGGIVIYHGDCRVIVSCLRGRYGVVITDPPYGCNATTGRGGAYNAFKIEGDHDTTLRDWVLDELKCPSILFGSPRIARPPCRAVLIWSKGEHTGMGDLSFPWKPNFEEIYINGEGFSGPRTSSVLTFNAAIGSDRHHPTEKPVGLMAALILKAPQGIILDPFMGSGATLVAAKNVGRQCIGIEVDERYCEIAVRRLQQGVLAI